MSEEQGKSIALDKIRLGMTKEGRILAGEANSKGVIKVSKYKDVTDDFHAIVDLLISLQMKLSTKTMEKVLEENEKKKMPLDYPLNT